MHGDRESILICNTDAGAYKMMTPPFKSGDRVRWSESGQHGTVKMCDDENVWVDWDAPHEYEDKLVRLPEPDLERVEQKERREPITITHNEFDKFLEGQNPVGELFGLVEGHFYGVRNPNPTEQDDPAYDSYMEEQKSEHEREMAHGGKSKCPHCDEYAITHFTVNPQDPTSCEHCENCGMEQMFGDWRQGEPGPAPKTRLDDPPYA